MAGYIGSKASVVTPGAERKKVFSITTTTTSLTGLVYTPGFVHVYHNGVRLVDGTDYTATNGTSITLTTAAQNGDEVVVISYATFQTSDTVSASAGGTFTGDVTFSSKVGIGTSSPIDTFHAVGSDGATSRTTYQGATEFIFENNGDFSIDLSTGNANQAFINWHDTDAVQQGWLSYNHNGDYMRFGVNAAERMRIDSSGKVGIGTASPSFPLHLVGESQFEADGGGTSSVYRFTNSGTTSGDNSVVRVAINGTTASSYVQFGNSTDSNAGQIEYAHNINSMIFNTNAAEAMRITGAQRIYIGTTSSHAATTPALTLHGDADRTTLEVYRSSNLAGNDIQTWFSNIGGTGTKVADVEANGDFNSATGNYATLSDERLKQDITPANSQWDDIKALEFKNYRMINLVETMGDDAPVYFGVIAQQLEAAGMNGLVEDKVDDDTQEVTKVVKTSILQMKAVKALQEAMERIEALEAEVAALKGGA